MLPEDLGNWTYGYIGAAAGFSLFTLHGGSYFAAGFPMLFSAWVDPTPTPAFIDEMKDWMHITNGFNAFHRRR